MLSENDTLVALTTAELIAKILPLILHGHCSLYDYDGRGKVKFVPTRKEYHHVQGLDCQGLAGMIAM